MPSSGNPYAGVLVRGAWGEERPTFPQFGSVATPSGISSAPDGGSFLLGSSFYSQTSVLISKYRQDLWMCSWCSGMLIDQM